MIASTPFEFHFGGFTGRYLMDSLFSEQIFGSLIYALFGFLSTFAYSGLGGKFIEEVIRISRDH